MDFLYYNRMRVCRNSHKLKITLATTVCGEGDFNKRGVLTHLHFIYYLYKVYNLL